MVPSRTRTLQFIVGILTSSKQSAFKYFCTAISYRPTYTLIPIYLQYANNSKYICHPGKFIRLDPDNTQTRESFMLLIYIF